MDISLMHSRKASVFWLFMRGVGTNGTVLAGVGREQDTRGWLYQARNEHFVSYLLGG